MRKIFIILSILGIISLTACSVRRNTTGEENKTSANNTIEESATKDPNALMVEYNGEQYEVAFTMFDMKVYNSFEELNNTAEYVVIGEFVEDATQEIKRTYDANLQMEVYDSGYSVNKFRITRVLKGDINEEYIYIRQSYAYDDLHKQMVCRSGLTPMTKGSSWIYFLDGYCPDDIYHPLSDYYGRYPNRYIDLDRLNAGGYLPEEMGVWKKSDFRNNIYKEMVEYYELEFSEE